MEHIQFGAFIAQLRKEHQMTQLELADRLHVTDKAVSKWETGKGFPDLKLLEPLAQTLEVSLVELLQGERTSSPTLSVEEAGQVAARAMDQYQQTTVLRYLRLFRWVCTAAAVFCFLFLLPYLVYGVSQLYFHWVIEPQMGVIGSAEGPTVIITSSAPLFPAWFRPALLALLCAACGVLVFRLHCLERRLK